MTGVAFKLDVQGLAAAASWLAGMEIVEKHELLDTLGQLGVSQTRRRIASEKTTPGGRAWKKTRQGEEALFRSGSHLYDSIDHAVGATEVRWGSGWIGARVHQFGATITPVNAKALHFKIGGEDVFTQKVTIPARIYLGVSVENEREMEQTALRFIEAAS